MEKLKYNKRWFQGKHLYGVMPLDVDTLALLSDDGWHLFNVEDLATVEFPQEWVEHVGLVLQSLEYFIRLGKEAKRTGKSVLDITYPNEF